MSGPHRLQLVTPGEPDEPSQPSCPWEAAVAVALANGAISGVLIYEIDGGGGPGRIPIRTGLASILGMCEMVVLNIRTPGG